MEKPIRSALLTITLALASAAFQPAALASDGEKIAHDLGPSFDLDFDFGMKAVNLTSQAGPSLETDRFEKGFRVTRYGTWEGGLGPAIIWHYDNVDSGIKDQIFGMIGLYPLAGSTWTAEYFVPHRDDISAKPAPHFPYKSDDLASWSAGDRVSYAHTGGVVFEAGIGLGAWVGIGSTMTAAGEWKISVEKRDDFTAVVEITDKDIHELNHYAGNIVAHIGVSKFRGQSEAFSYAFDLRSTRARLAFEDFVRGNVLAVQKMTKEAGDSPDIYRVSRTSNAETGIGRHFFVGIPIFWNFEWGASRILNFSTEVNYPEAYTIKADYGVYYKERKHRFFFHHRNLAEGFDGAAYLYSDKETPEREEHYGEYYFTFAADKAGIHRLKQAVAEIIRQTGLVNELSVKVPDLEKPHYTGLEFRMLFGEEQTARMIAAARNMKRAGVIEIGARLHRKYFKGYQEGNQGWDTNDVCADWNWDDSRCYVGSQRDTESALSDMYDALLEMGKCINKDRKCFAAAYAAFGRGLSENMFTFQAGMKLAGDGLKVTYRIEGERLSRFDKQFTTSGENLHEIMASTPEMIRAAGL